MQVGCGWIQWHLRNFFNVRSVALSSLDINQSSLWQILVFRHGYSCHDLWPNRKNCRILAIINADRVHNSMNHIFGGGGSYRNKGLLMQIKACLRLIQHNNWSAKVSESRTVKLPSKMTWRWAKFSAQHFLCLMSQNQWHRHELWTDWSRQQIFKSKPERSSHKKKCFILIKWASYCFRLTF